MKILWVCSKRSLIRNICIIQVIECSLRIKWLEPLIPDLYFLISLGGLWWEICQSFRFVHSSNWQSFLKLVFVFVMLYAGVLFIQHCFSIAHITIRVCVDCRKSYWLWNVWNSTIFRTYFFYSERYILYCECLCVLTRLVCIDERSSFLEVTWVWNLQKFSNIVKLSHLQPFPTLKYK